MNTENLPIHLAHLRSSQLFLKKAKKQTVRELSRKTPDSLGAKLLTASTALRAFLKQAARHAHAMLRGVGTRGEML